MPELSWTFQDAIRLVLLYHDGQPWGPQKCSEWKRITGVDVKVVDARRVMLEHLRGVLGGAGAFAPGSQCEHGDRLMSITVGQVVDQQMVDDVQALLADNNEMLSEERSEYVRGFDAALLEIGGTELADAHKADVVSDFERIAAKAAARALTMLKQKREEAVKLAH